MRTLALFLGTALITIALAAPSAVAAPSVCTTESYDATLVRVEVTVGGLGCLDASVERCTLEHDPEYPSHPYWVCHDVL